MAQEAKLKISLDASGVEAGEQKARQHLRKMKSAVEGSKLYAPIRVTVMGMSYAWRMLRTFAKPITVPLRFGYNLLSRGISGIGSILSRIAIPGALTGGALSYTVKEANEFARAMASVNTVMDDATWLPRFANEIRDLAVAFGQSKVQLAGGLKEILSSGFSESEAMPLLRAAAMAAKAGGAEIESTVKLTRSLIRSFHMDAADAMHTLDVLFESVRIGNHTLSELGESLAEVTSIAASRGIAFEDLAAAVTTLTRLGVPTANAVTQIRSAIVGTSEVLGTAWGKTMNLGQAFAAMRKAAGDDMVVLKERVGRIEGLNGILGLTGKNAAIYIAAHKAMQKASGATEVAFGKVMKEEHWLRVGQALARVVESVGKSLDQALKPAINRIADALNSTFRDNEGVSSFLAKLETGARAVGSIIERMFGTQEQRTSATEDVKAILVAAFRTAADTALDVLKSGATAVGNAIADGFIGKVLPEWAKPLAPLADAGPLSAAQKLGKMAGDQADGGTPNWLKKRIELMKHDAKFAATMLTMTRGGQPDFAARLKALADWRAGRDAINAKYINQPSGGEPPIADKPATRKSLYETLAIVANRPSASSRPGRESPLADTAGNPVEYIQGRIAALDSEIARMEALLDFRVKGASQDKLLRAGTTMTPEANRPMIWDYLQTLRERRKNFRAELAAATPAAKAGEVAPSEDEQSRKADAEKENADKKRAYKLSKMTVAQIAVELSKEADASIAHLARQRRSLPPGSPELLRVESATIDAVMARDRAVADAARGEKTKTDKKATDEEELKRRAIETRTAGIRAELAAMGAHRPGEVWTTGDPASKDFTGYAQGFRTPGSMRGMKGLGDIRSFKALSREIKRQTGLGGAGLGVFGKADPFSRETTGVDLGGLFDRRYGKGVVGTKPPGTDQHNPMFVKEVDPPTVTGDNG